MPDLYAQNVCMDRQLLPRAIEGPSRDNPH